jgi:hypothetical protein
MPERFLGPLCDWLLWPQAVILVLIGVWTYITSYGLILPVSVTSEGIRFWHGAFF